MKKLNLLSFFLIFFTGLMAQPSNYQDYYSQGILNNNLIEDLGREGIELSKKSTNGNIEFSNSVKLPVVLNSLEKITQSEFRFKRIDKSRLSATKKFFQYDQFYRNVKIESSHLSILIKDQKPVAIYPKIFRDIKIQTSAKITLDQIESTILKQDIVDSELLISPLFGDYTLVWKISHNDDYPKTTWVDANNGTILKTIERKFNLLGCTQTYGVQTINDNTQGGVTTLESPNGDIVVYNDGGFFCNWDENTIPSTTFPVWSFDPSVSKHCIQAMHTATEIQTSFECLDIEFGTINVDCGISQTNAFSLGCSTVDDAFVSFGTHPNGTSLALYDVMGHELGHTYLNQFLNYTDPTANAALHEGIADILGTYTESKVNGLDWVIGDDEPIIAGLVNRDLSEPFCLGNSSSSHTNGLAIGHWFYLMSQGDNSLGIDPLGLDAAVNIILEALPMVGPNAGYPEMSEAILNVMADEFGLCSNELQSAINAWDEVCVTAASTPGISEPVLLAGCRGGASSLACIFVVGQSTNDFIIEPRCFDSPNGMVIPNVYVEYIDDPSCNWTFENIIIPACNSACPGITPSVEFSCTGELFEACAKIDGLDPEDSPWQIFPECVEYGFGQEIPYTLVWKADPSCQFELTTTLPDCSDVGCEKPEITIQCSIFGEACLIVDGQAVPNAEWGIYGPSCRNTDYFGAIQYHIFNQDNPVCQFMGKIILPDCNGGGGENQSETRESVMQNTKNNENIDANEIKIFPNPVNDILNISLDSDFNGILEIMDSNGKLILRQNAVGYNHFINVDNISSGLYLLRVLDQSLNKQEIKKFIKN